MSEFRTNLWAPWRMEYIRSLAEENEGGCFLCRYGQESERDALHHVLWRTDHTLVVMNRFPYTNGHLLVAPFRHAEDLNDLPPEVFYDLWHQTREAKQALAELLHPNGFNIGINLGHCAGAGLPGHLHLHIVPRWTGDTNFMAVLGDIRVVPESLASMYEQLRATCRAHGLPRPRPVA